MHGTIARHGGERVAAALQAHGVRFLFTLCGGHISPILAASKALGIRIVDVRDEATAVFAADAAARLTGLPGVAAVTAGPGLTNTITALKNAQLAQSPVILLGGAAPTALQGRGALQDIDQRSLIAPHVKLLRRIRRVRDLAPAVEEAFEVAREGVQGPVFIECPVDLLYDEASIRQWYADAAGRGAGSRRSVLRRYLARHANRLFAAGRGAEIPSPQELRVPAPTRRASTARRVVAGTRSSWGEGISAPRPAANSRLAWRARSGAGTDRRSTRRDRRRRRYHWRSLAFVVQQIHGTLRRSRSPGHALARDRHGARDRRDRDRRPAAPGWRASHAARRAAAARYPEERRALERRRRRARRCAPPAIARVARS